MPQKRIISNQLMSWSRCSGCDTDPGVLAALEQAARALADAGCVVEEAEPPHFDEANALWRQLVQDDMRRRSQTAIEALGDAVGACRLRLLPGRRR